MPRFSEILRDVRSQILWLRINLWLSCICATALLASQLMQRSEASAAGRPEDRPRLGLRAVQVAIYNDTGAANQSVESVEDCLTKNSAHDYSIRRVTGEQIRGGVLDGVDVAVFPGGSGSAQAKSLMQAGREKIRRFVQRGGGYLGIDGGAYLASSYYPWSLNIVNATIVDRQHWARGQADVRLDLTVRGKQMLAVRAASLLCEYNEGPLLGPDNKPDLPPYEPLATFGTEVAENGAPAGVMIGTHAMLRAVCGHGRVLLISPHPEHTDGLDYIVKAAVKWVSEPEITANPLTGDTTNAKAAQRPPLPPATQSLTAR